MSTLGLKKNLGAGLMAFGLTATWLADPFAASLLLLVPIIPFLYFFLWRAVAGAPLFASIFSIMVIYVLCGNFRYRELAEKAIDLQVTSKLLAIVVMLGVSMLYLPKIWRYYNTSGLLSWIGFFAFIGLTSTYSQSPAYSAVSVISILSSFLFLCHLCERYGDKAILDIVLYASLILGISSILAYFLAPNFARVTDWNGDEMVLTWRLQGVFGSPNDAGLASAGTILVATILYPAHARLRTWVVPATILVALSNLTLSQN